MEQVLYAGRGVTIWRFDPDFTEVKDNSGKTNQPQCGADGMQSVTS